MRAADLIIKKRDGAAMTGEEIQWLIHSYLKNEVPDYQMAAWLMTVFFSSMNAKETAALTLAMAHSGRMIDLSAVPGIKVDKHSTGGVADTTTLILAPLVAAAGVPVAKMSGRGLGFTGGTIDKLEAIPGFQATLSEDIFKANLLRHGIAITGQSPEIAPADGRLYALRDVTGTIESIPLIASSIMSKKIAAGADKILLDVKVGSGAFMKDLNQGISLATAMVQIGQQVNRETVAVISNMDEPLGQAVGNSLEIKEAIEVLSGHGPIALRNICLLLGAHMLLLAQKVSSVEAGEELLKKLIENGEALRKFRDFIAAQSGNSQITTEPALLPQASLVETVVSPIGGYVQQIDASFIGYCAMLLGAGREKKGDTIDLSAGLVLHHRVGDKIEEGEPLITLHGNKQDMIHIVSDKVKQAIVIKENRIVPPPLVLGIVDQNGFRPS